MADTALVIGGTGLVGGAVRRALAARGRTAASTGRRPAPGIEALDLTVPGAAARLLDRLRPAWVYLPAANPHVDYCQLHPEETRAVNVKGTWETIAAARERGAKVVFFSSDYVFDGAKGSYTEEDAPSPLNEYGRQKAEIESRLLALDPGSLVVRTSGVYGWQAEPKNFVLQLRRRLAAGETMEVAADLSYNPTWADDLAQAAAELAESGRGGVWHAAGADELTRYEFAALAARAFGLDASRLAPVPAARFPSPAPRPRRSSLDSSKLRAALGRAPRGAAEGLAAMAAAAPVLP